MVAANPEPSQISINNPSLVPMAHLNMSPKEGTHPVA